LEKNLRQRSLAEAMLVDHDALKELDVVNELIDWSRLEQQLSGVHSKKQDEKAWAPLMMFKAIPAKLVQAQRSCAREATSKRPTVSLFRWFGYFRSRSRSLNVLAL